MLEVTDLRVHYGVIEAVKGIDFTLDHGEITTLLGANGAGKSTTLAGVVGSGKGQRRFGRCSMASKSPIGRPHQIVARGLVQVAEGRQILTRLSVTRKFAAWRLSTRSRAAGRQEILKVCWSYFLVYANDSTAPREISRVASSKCLRSRAH